VKDAMQTFELTFQGKAGNVEEEINMIDE